MALKLPVAANIVKLKVFGIKSDFVDCFAKVCLRNSDLVPFPIVISVVLFLFLIFVAPSRVNSDQRKER